MTKKTHTTNGRKLPTFVPKLRRIVLFSAAASMLVSGLAVSPASAAIPSVLSNGYGEFTAVSAVTSPDPNAPCALYSEYHANLEFVVGTSTYTFETTSDPRKAWGENGNGTYGTVNLPAVPGCSGASGQIVNGFSGTLTGNDGTTAVVCSFTGLLTPADGTYRRGIGTPNPELNVQFTAKLGGAGCPASSVGTTLTVKATIPDVALPPPYLPPFFLEYASACSGVIAPQSCVLGPATW